MGRYQRDTAPNNIPLFVKTPWSLNILNLKKLFRPKSLALVGGYWADFVVQGNRKLGFNGPIWHINPKRKDSKKNKYYKNIKDLPGVPDCVYIAVSRDLTVNIIKTFCINPNSCYSFII